MRNQAMPSRQESKQTWMLSNRWTKFSTLMKLMIHSLLRQTNKLQNSTFLNVSKSSWKIESSLKIRSSMKKLSGYSTAWLHTRQSQVQIALIRRPSSTRDSWDRKMQKSGSLKCWVWFARSAMMCQWSPNIESMNMLRNSTKRQFGSSSTSTKSLASSSGIRNKSRTSSRRSPR